MRIYCNFKIIIKQIKILLEMFLLIEEYLIQPLNLCLRKAIYMIMLQMATQIIVDNLHNSISWPGEGYLQGHQLKCVRNIFYLNILYLMS